MRSQISLNSAADNFQSGVSTLQSLPLSSSFVGEESTSDMEISEPGISLQNEYSTVSTNLEHNPSSIIIETETNHSANAHHFYSPWEPSEYVAANLPEVVEADTPDLSYIESGESADDLQLMNSSMLIDNYVLQTLQNLELTILFMLCL